MIPSIRGFKRAERLAPLCHSWPEGAGCGDPSRRRGGRISSARSRKAVAAKLRFHGLRRKPLVGTPAIHQATDFARE